MTPCLRPLLPALGAALAGAVLLTPTPVQAGIPECGGVRLEDAFACEIRGDVMCTASCDDLGVYKKACATRLHTVCRDTCTLDAEITCVDECTVPCQEQCDAGVNVICQHNCYGECEGTCSASCAGAADAETCMASCQATCDGECDVQCAPVVGASCYQHCIECCGGSCGAQANMTCQTSCQEEQFEDCEFEFRADCMGSCSGDGALFCDGEFVLAGDQIDECVEALVAIGLEAINMGLDDLEASGFCSVSDRQEAPLGLGLLVLGGLAGWARRRRQAA